MLITPPMTRTPSEDEIRRHLPLVHRVVARLQRRLPPNVLGEDLIAAGMRGLVDALRRHVGDDESFERYARIRIRGAVLDELRAQDWMPRRLAGDEAPRSVVRSEDLGAAEQAASFVDHQATDACSALEAQEEMRAVVAALEGLPERERIVVRMRYFEGLGISDIGARLDVSGPRVSQLHTRAMARLRELLA